MFSTPKCTDGEKRLNWSQQVRVGVTKWPNHQWNETKISRCDRCRSVAGVKPKLGYVRCQQWLRIVVTMVTTTLSCYVSVSFEALSHFLCCKSISGSSRQPAAALRPTVPILHSTSGPSLTQQLQFGSHHTTLHTRSHHATDETQGFMPNNGRRLTMIPKVRCFYPSWQHKPAYFCHCDLSMTGFETCTVKRSYTLLCVCLRTLHWRCVWTPRQVSRTPTVFVTSTTSSLTWWRRSHLLSFILNCTASKKNCLKQQPTLRKTVVCPFSLSTSQIRQPGQSSEYDVVITSVAAFLW